MKNQKVILKKYTFSTEERDKLRQLEAGITVSRAQVDGMQIYKDAVLSSVYKRLGIDGDPKKGFTKNIRYNLGSNEIEYTETEKKEELAKK